MKSSHHLWHDRASIKGHGSIPCLMSQTDLHRIQSWKHACKEVCDVKQGVDPYPLLVWSCDRSWPDFVTFTACKRSIFGLKRGKKAQCVWNRCKDLFKRKNYLGVMGTLTRSDICTKSLFFPVLSNSEMPLAKTKLKISSKLHLSFPVCSRTALSCSLMK